MISHYTPPPLDIFRDFFCEALPPFEPRLINGRPLITKPTLSIRPSVCLKHNSNVFISDNKAH